MMSMDTTGGTAHRVSPDRFWAETRDLLSGQRLSVLVGSAISRGSPASLPMFNDVLASAICDIAASLPSSIRSSAPEIRITPEALITDDAAFLLSNTRPELLLGTLQNLNAGVADWLGRLFSSEKFNRTHDFLAGLLATHRIRRIFTTNFDCCLENALARRGLRAGPDYAVVASPQDRVIDTEDRPSITHVHGVASRPGTLRFTLEGEHAFDSPLAIFRSDTNTVFVSNNAATLRERLTAAMQTDALLVVGYSGRDAVFRDAIRSRSRQPVYWLFYKEASAQERQFVLRMAERAQVALIYTDGDVVDLPALAPEIQTSAPPFAAEGRPLPWLTWREREAVTAWFTLMRMFFPRSLSGWIAANRGVLDPFVAGSTAFSFLLAEVHRSMGEWSNAITVLEKASEDVDGRGSRSGKSFCKSWLAITLAEGGRIADAGRLLEEVDRDAREMSAQELAWHEYTLAEFHRARRDFSRSLTAAKKAAELAKRLGDILLLSYAHNTIGFAHHELGNRKDALPEYEASLQLKEELGLPRDIAHTLNNIGRLLMDEGDLASAARHFEESLAMKLAASDKFGLGSAYTNLGALYLRMGDLDAAERHTVDGINHKHATGDVLRLPSSLINLGAIRHQQERFEEAIRSWHECCSIAVRVGAVAEIARLMTGVRPLLRLPDATRRH